MDKKLISIYQLKVVLNDTNPPVFRVFQIKSNANLGKLHDYLQGVMGWTDSHLHEFKIKGRKYQSVEQMDDDATSHTYNERRYYLNKLVNEGDTFEYIYDFGDNWKHKIIV